MFTGRSPTDDMFKDSVDLHTFSEAALRLYPIEPWRLPIQHFGCLKKQSRDAPKAALVRSRTEGCLVSVIGLGVSCSKKQPRERMRVQDAAVQMHAIRDAYLNVTTAMPAC